MGVELGLIPDVLWHGRSDDQPIGWRRAGVPGPPWLHGELSERHAWSSLRRICDQLQPLAQMLILAGHRIETVHLGLGNEWLHLSGFDRAITIDATGPRPGFGASARHLVLEVAPLPLEVSADPSAQFALPLVLDGTLMSGLGGTAHLLEAEIADDWTSTSALAIAGRVRHWADQRADEAAAAISSAWATTSHPQASRSIFYDYVTNSGLMESDQAELLGLAITNALNAVAGRSSIDPPPPLDAERVTALLEDERSPRPTPLEDRFVDFFGTTYMESHRRLTRLRRLQKQFGVSIEHDSITTFLLHLHQDGYLDLFAGFTTPTTGFDWADVVARCDDETLPLTSDEVEWIVQAIEDSSPQTLRGSVLNRLFHDSFEVFADDALTRSRIRSAFITGIARAPFGDVDDESAESLARALHILLFDGAPANQLDAEYAETWAQWQAKAEDAIAGEQLIANAIFVFHAADPILAAAVVRSTVDHFAPLLSDYRSQHGVHWSATADFETPSGALLGGWSRSLAGMTLRTWAFIRPLAPAAVPNASAMRSIAGESPLELFDLSEYQRVYAQVLDDSTNADTVDALALVAAAADYQNATSELERQRIDIERIDRDLLDLFATSSVQADFETAQTAGLRAALDDPTITIDAVLDQHEAWTRNDYAVGLFVGMNDTEVDEHRTLLRERAVLLGPTGLERVEGGIAALDSVRACEQVLASVSDADIDSYVDAAPFTTQNPGVAAPLKQLLKASKSYTGLRRQLITLPLDMNARAAGIERVGTLTRARHLDLALRQAKLDPTALQAAGYSSLDDFRTQIRNAESGWKDVGRFTSAVVGVIAGYQLWSRVSSLDGIEDASFSGFLSGVGEARDVLIGAVDLAVLFRYELTWALSFVGREGWIVALEGLGSTLSIASAGFSALKYAWDAHVAWERGDIGLAVNRAFASGMSGVGAYLLFVGATGWGTFFLAAAVAVVTVQVIYRAIADAWNDYLDQLAFEDALRRHRIRYAPVVELRLPDDGTLLGVDLNAPQFVSGEQTLARLQPALSAGIFDPDAPDLERWGGDPAGVDRVAMTVPDNTGIEWHLTAGVGMSITEIVAAQIDGSELDEEFVLFRGTPALEVWIEPPSGTFDSIDTGIGTRVQVGQQIGIDEDGGSVLSPCSGGVVDLVTSSVDQIDPNDVVTRVVVRTNR